MDRGPTGKTIWQLLSRVAFAAIIAVGLAIPVLAASGAFSVPAEPDNPNGASLTGELAEAASIQGVISAFVTVLDPNADSDGDGVLNGQDNCPSVHNPNQTNSDADLNTEGVTIFDALVPADALGDACDLDDDNDSPLAFPSDWTDEVELYLTNNPTAQTETCPRTLGVTDYWMPDTNIDRAVNVLDLLPFKAQFKAAAGDPGSPSRRMDFNMDGTVDVLDLLPFKHSFKATCTVPPL